MGTRCPSCSCLIEESVPENPTDRGEGTVCTECGYDLSRLTDDPEATSQYTASEEADSNRRIGNFYLLQQLGQGAYGSVWLAEDQNLDRRVALKLPKPQRSDDVLLHEAKTAAKLKHANIVSIYEVGAEDGQVFIASEFIDGEDLLSELTRGRPSEIRATELTSKLASAVYHAHTHGVIHRDLKPANIIIDSDGEPYIADFGIAKQIDANETISTDGAVVGTISYMSPEQAKGQTRKTDHRSDVYALGVILFEMLTEYRPFRGNARAVLHQKIYEEPPSPRQLVPSLHRDLETICMKCLEREPAKRYQSALQLSEELHRYREGEPIQARPINRIAKTWRWCRRKPIIAGLLAGIISSLTIGLVGITFFWLKADRNALQMRQALYRANMNAASNLWTNGDLRALKARLKASQPGGPLEDLRDFSCAYYEQLLDIYAQVVNHGDAVVAVAVSSDGKYFASAGIDRIIQVWSSESGDLVRTIQTRSGKLVSLEYVPGTPYLFSGHSNGQIQIWNPVQHDRVVNSFSHGTQITKLVAARRGKRLASASSNGRVKLWSVAMDKPVPVSIDTGKKAVVDLQFSSDGNRLAVAIWNGALLDGEVQLWDVSASTINGQEGETLGGTAKLDSWAIRGVQSVAFERDDSIVMGTYRGSLVFRDLETGEQHTASTAAHAAIGDVLKIAGSDRLVFAALKPSMAIVEDRKVVRRFTGTQYSFGMLAQSTDAERNFFVTSGGDGTVSLLSSDRLEKGDIYWRPLQVRGLAFASNNELAICDGDGAAQLLNIETMKAEELVPASGREFLSVDFNPSSCRIAICGMQREVTLIDSKKRDIENEIRLPFAGFSAIEFSSTGKHFLVGARNGSLFGFQTADVTAASVSMERGSSKINDISADDSSPRFAVASAENTIEIFDPASSDKPLGVIELEVEPTAVAFCQDGATLIVGTQTGKIMLLDASTYQQQLIIDAHAGRVNTLAVFPSGSQFASGGRDRGIYIWDSETGEKISQFHHHRRQVFDIAIAPDGQVMASASLNGDVRIWRGR